MEKENIRAKNLGISSPICKNKKATDLNFDKALEHIIDKVHVCNLFIGSHNEESIIKATKLMKKINIKIIIHSFGFLNFMEWLIIFHSI